MWKWLRDRRFSDYKFRRQHALGDYVLDFFCCEARLNIELDGWGHGHPEKQARDAVRDAWLAERGILVLRLWNRRLRSERQAVRDEIWRALQERAPQAMPSYWRVGRAGSHSREEVNGAS